MTFILGANGTGKSSFMGRVAQHFPHGVTRIAAFRQITLGSSAVSVTGSDRLSQAENSRYYYAQDNFRYQDVIGASAVSSAIYDIHAAQNAFAQAQSASYSRLDPNLPDHRESWLRVTAQRSPFQRLEAIVKGAGMQLEFEIDQRGVIQVTRGGSPPYGIHEMSDGERSALLLASTVLTAEPGNLILIDEPERHLHRSISSPLIHGLLRERSDCAFAISTHDTSLPLDQPDCSVLLLRAYQHGPMAWDAEYVQSIDTLEEDVAESILGSRKTIIFVEGERSSPDYMLYSHLFCGTSVRSQRSCADVIRATRGVNETRSEHRVRAVGVIDRDRRSDEDVERLAIDGVVALDVHSIESVYYHPEVVRLAARRLEAAGSIGFTEVDSVLEQRMVQAFRERRETLVRDAAVRRVRELVLGKLPKAKDFDGGKFPEAGLSSEAVAAIHDDEVARFDALILEADVAKLGAAYPVKRTGISRAVCDLLKLKDGESYSEIVRKMVVDDKAAADLVRCIVGPLSLRVAE
jgi:predicted ATPase